MIHSDLYVENTGEILAEGLRGGEETVFLINPTQETMRELVSTFSTLDVQSGVQLFADEGQLKDLTDDFIVASTIADLVAEDTLSVRTLSEVPHSSFLLTDSYVVSLVENETKAAGLVSTEESFVSSTYSHYAERWRDAETFSLRTPALSHIRETLAEDIGTSAVDDFNAILDTLDTARGGGEGLDEVTIALLVAANNGELLYDISRWGEDIRLASKATFSRSKNRLEDNGLLDTEKVPIDVGRPRLRLMLGDGDLREADIEKVTQRAQSVLE
jgi:hypothetical protein